MCREGAVIPIVCGLTHKRKHQLAFGRLYDVPGQMLVKEMRGMALTSFKELAVSWGGRHMS